MPVRPGTAARGRGRVVAGNIAGLAAAAAGLVLGALGLGGAALVAGAGLSALEPGAAVDVVNLLGGLVDALGAVARALHPHAAAARAARRCLVTFYLGAGEPGGANQHGVPIE